MGGRLQLDRGEMRSGVIAAGRHLADFIQNDVIQPARPRQAGERLDHENNEGNGQPGSHTHAAIVNRPRPLRKAVIRPAFVQAGLFQAGLAPALPLQ